MTGVWHHLIRHGPHWVVAVGASVAICLGRIDDTTYLLAVAASTGAKALFEALRDRRGDVTPGR